MSNLNSECQELSKKEVENEKIFLDLCWLNLDDFPLSSYKKYKNIQHIYLEGNKVKKLHEDFFLSFPKLKWLDIRNNELEEIPKTIVNHPSLQVLLLEGNKLEDLPLELGSIPNLRGVQLTGNPLRNLPKTIVAKGSAEVLQFLQKEWKNREKNSTINSSLQSCKITSTKTQSTRSSAQKRKENYSLIRKFGKTISQPAISKKPLSNLKDCVRVTKLVRPKTRTAVKIFKDWSSVVDNSEQLLSDESTENEMVSRPKTVSNSQERFSNISTQRESCGLLAKPNMLKDTWLRRIRDVLAEQESELQRTRNKDFLSKWQNDAKDLQVQKWTQYIQGDAPKLEVPFGIDEEYSKILPRDDAENREKSLKLKKKSTKNIELNGDMVASKINSLLDVLQQLRKARSCHSMSPRSKQQNFNAEIKKITELQRTISSLKTINFAQSVKLQ